MKILKFMLLFVPISFIGKFLNFSPTIMFILAALSIIPLAGIMGEGTEEISSYTGPKIGGFLNATFGNATELIISFFALKSGLFEVVKSSIAGSIIGNILLVLGASMFIGGLKHKTQNFNINVVETTSSMLLFSLIGLCVPAFFTHTINPNLLNTRYEGLSLVVAIVMFILYILSLIFSFFTHKDLYATTTEEEGHESKWSLKKSIIILVIATVIIAIESEFLVGGIEDITSKLGLSEFFVGIILIVAPVLIFLSLLFTPMSIIFNPFELVSLIASVIIANKVASDGQSNWLEGAQLMAVYFIIAAGFFIL